MLRLDRVSTNLNADVAALGDLSFHISLLDSSILISHHRVSLDGSLSKLDSKRFSASITLYVGGLFFLVPNRRGPPPLSDDLLLSGTCDP